MIVVAELVVWALYMPSYSLIPNTRGFSGLQSMTDWRRAGAYRQSLPLSQRDRPSLLLNPGMLVPARLVVELQLFGEWRSSDEVCEIGRGESLYVANAKIPKNVVNRRTRFPTNDVAKATFKSVLKCQPRKCG